MNFSSLYNLFSSFPANLFLRMKQQQTTKPNRIKYDIGLKKNVYTDDERV